MPDIILEGDHPRIISAKLGWDWLSSFRGEDFFLISSPLFSIFSLAAILAGSQDHRTQFWKGAIQGPFHHSFVAIGPVVSEERFLCEFPIGSYVQLSSAVQPSWSEGGTTRHNLRGPSNDYFIKVWFQLSNWFKTRRFLCEFPIGSYVKLRSAVGAIFVEGPNRRTHFEREPSNVTISSKFSSYWANGFRQEDFLC